MDVDLHKTGTASFHLCIDVAAVEMMVFYFRYLKIYLIISCDSTLSIITKAHQRLYFLREPKQG